jgi:hypothetical protein
VSVTGVAEKRLSQGMKLGIQLKVSVTFGAFGSKRPIIPGISLSNVLLSKSVSVNCSIA